MSEIGLKITEEKEKLPISTSKLFGNPGVWDGFEWPQFTESGEDYDLTFMCQINCTDAASFDTEGLLPKTGMLYFFYDMDEMPSESIKTNASRVLYYDGDPASLHEMLRTDQDGNDMSFREMKITFNEKSEQPHALLNAPPMEGWQPLLQIHAFETDKIMINFSGKSALCFYVRENHIENKDFSEIFVRLI